MSNADQAGGKRVVSFKAPPQLRDWLSAKAEEGYRSMGAQVRLLAERAMKEDLEKENAPLAATSEAS